MGKTSFGDIFTHSNLITMANGLPDFLTKEIEKPAEQPKAEVETPKQEAPKEEAAPTEQPKVETPKAEQKKEVPAFDFKTIDERIATPDDIKTFLSERDKYAQELEEAKNKLSQYNGYIKPADEEISKLNEIKAKGGNVDLFLQMRAIDPQSLKEDEAVKLMWQFQDGLTSQDADRKVKILYKTGKDLNALQAEITAAKDPNHEKYDLEKATRLEDEMEHIYLAQGELKAAGKKAKEFLGGLKVKSQEVPDVEKIQSDVRETWKPHVSKYIPKDISIPFKVENPDKSVTELNVKFALDAGVEKDIQEFLQGTVEYFTSQGIPYSEEQAMKLLPSEVKTKILGKNFDTIANRMVNAAIEAERNRVKDAIHATPKAAEKTEGKGKEQDAAATVFFNTVKGIQTGAIS